MTQAPSDTALILIDLQNDFCPGGALAVADGDQVMAPANRILDRFSIRVLSQDWHPAHHESFARSHPGAEPYTTFEAPYGTQVLWPDHCVQGTEGAAFHPDLHVDRADLILRKGYHPGIDSYSAFFENDRETPTGLGGYLRERGAMNVVIGGLATDFCVRWSALDATRLGFGVTVATDLCRAIDLDGSLTEAMEEMAEIGVAFRRSEELFA